jgi:hypothetical protein
MHIEDRCPDDEVNWLALRSSQRHKRLSFYRHKSRFEMPRTTTVTMHDQDPSALVETPQLIAVPMAFSSGMQHDDVLGPEDRCWP